MKIEDISKIYELLGNLHFVGFASLTVLIAISLWILMAATPNNGINKRSAFWIIGLLVVALTSLYIDSVRKTRILKVANFIIQDMIGTNFKQKSFSEMKLPGDTDTTAKHRNKVLKDVSDEFPQQFSVVELNKNVYGFVVIDPKAVAKIDSQLNAKAERTSRLLVSIINTGQVDTVFLDQRSIQTLKLTDNEGYLIKDSFFQLLVGRNNLLPIYDTNWHIMGFTIIKKKISLQKQNKL